MTSEGVRCVEFWKERGAQEKKTYRCILDYSSWDEHDAKYVVDWSLTLAKANSFSSL